MATAKEEVREMLEQLPEDATLEDIQYHLYVRELLDGRLKELPSAKLVPQQEVERRMAKWLGNFPTRSRPETP